MKRYQHDLILRDLRSKMVLLAGPRQAGKTVLSKLVAENYSSPTYLNWDSLPDRDVITLQAWLPSTDLVIFDEIHKMPDWKNYLKGVYDTRPETLHILVTGSARLDIFNHVGDSLAGRYFLHRLLPLSLAELRHVGHEVNLERLIERGGFPEPFLAEDDVTARRWRIQYTESLLRIDVLEFDKIQNVAAIRTLFELLRERVGSPISFSSLARDLAISPHTVKRYIEMLEALFIVFRITPFSRDIARSLLKEPKIYFFDTGLVKGDEGVVFENMVAVSLLKYVYERIDYRGEECRLAYLRTKAGNEVDFAIVKDNAVEEVIEAKNRRGGVGKSLQYFSEKYNFPAKQVVRHLDYGRMSGKITVLPATEYLSGLTI